jgi:mono/diheme cytochrome c family protein
MTRTGMRWRGWSGKNAARMREPAPSHATNRLPSQAVPLSNRTVTDPSFADVVSTLVTALPHCRQCHTQARTHSQPCPK